MTQMYFFVGNNLCLTHIVSWLLRIKFIALQCILTAAVYPSLSSSHPPWFPTPQRLPCLAWGPLTTVSMCSSRSWSSGRANRAKRSLWPPASSSAHTQLPLLQTWAPSFYANMSRYHATGIALVTVTWKLIVLYVTLMWTNCVVPGTRVMLLMCLKPTLNCWRKWCCGCHIRSKRLQTPTLVSLLPSLITPGSTICLK